MMSGSGAGIALVRDMSRPKARASQAVKELRVAAKAEDPQALWESIKRAEQHMRAARLLMIGAPRGEDR